MTVSNLTAERLREVLAYDPNTGIFTRRIRTSNFINIGDVAGWKSNTGYIKISVDGREYRAQRLAWLFIYGTWPIADVDHVDGVRTNNAIANLRDVSRSVNMENQRRPRGKTASGFLGVAPANQATGFCAHICVRGKTTHLGTFPTPELAHAAYIEAKRRLHEGNTL